MAKAKHTDGPVTIKKYANRRLYNTATSSYVTLDDLAAMVRDKVEFQVFDAKSGEDITRPVLTQIIVEEEAKGQNLLPISFLRQLISFYGDSLQGLVPKYLEQSMASFSRNQEQMRDYLSNAFDGMFPFGNIEEMGKQNMAMVEQAMQMMNPFQRQTAESSAKKPPTETPSADKPSTEDSADASLQAMQQQIEALQAQIAKLGKGN